MLNTALSKLLAAKAIAAIVLVAGATGGVALAATATSTDSPPAASESNSGEAGSAVTVEAAHADGRKDQSGDPAAAAGTPTPSLRGLCRAWAVGAPKDGATKDSATKDSPGQGATAKEPGGPGGPNPAFSALIAAAGSVGGVEGFCATLPTDDASVPAADGPGHQSKDPAASHSTAVPTVAPVPGPGNSDHTTDPAGQNVDHPSGRPTESPAPLPAPSTGH